MLQAVRSIGIALHPQHGRKAGNLLHCADIAMYTAKRDRLVVALYEPDLEQCDGEDVVLRQNWSGRSGRASWFCTISPRSTFALLQPVGLEALVRWQHPDYGGCRQTNSSRWRNTPTSSSP